MNLDLTTRKFIYKPLKSRRHDDAVHVSTYLKYSRLKMSKTVRLMNFEGKDDLMIKK